MKLSFKAFIIAWLTAITVISAPPFLYADLTTLAASFLTSNVTTLGANPIIHASTADGADSQEFDITAGGAYATDGTRGARIEMTGNENGSLAGGMLIQGGNGNSGANLILRNAGTSAGNGTAFQKSTGATVWTIPDTGSITSDATNGGNVIFSKAFTDVVHDMATLAGAGSTQTDAAAIAHVISRVTGANGTVGVKLPALASVTSGTLLYIVNSSTASALKYYSNASGETIDGQTGTTANSLAAKLWAVCLAYDSSNWYCADSVIPF